MSALGSNAGRSGTGGAEGVAGRGVRRWCCSCVVVDGALTRIAVTRNVDVIDGFEVVKKVLPEQPSKRGPRSETVGFAVLFGDGKVIAEKSAKMTWIQALRYMGLERVAGYKGGVVGFPMVGKRKRNNSKNRGVNIKPWLMGGGCILVSIMIRK